MTNTTSGSMGNRSMFTMKQGRIRLICVIVCRIGIRWKGKKIPKKVVSWPVKKSGVGVGVGVMTASSGPHPGFPRPTTPHEPRGKPDRSRDLRVAFKPDTGLNLSYYFNACSVLDSAEKRPRRTTGSHPLALKTGQTVTVCFIISVGIARGREFTPRSKLLRICFMMRQIHVDFSPTSL